MLQVKKRKKKGKIELENKTVNANTNNSSKNAQVKNGGILTIIKNYGFIVPMMLIIIVLFSTVFTLGNIPSMSMYPTLDVGAGLFAVKADKDDIYRGEIIMFHPNEEEGEANELWIKRIIGLPGDTVEFDEENVYVNGEKLDEPYLNQEEPIEYEPDLYEVPEDCIFVLGDNRNDSLDSRFWEDPYLPIASLTSKPLVTFPMSVHCSSGFKILNNGR